MEAIGSAAFTADRSEVVHALRRVAAFAQLTDDQLMALAATGVQRSVASGVAAFAEGDPSDGLHVVLAGRLRIGLNAADGTEIELGLVGPGDSYGEVALLDGGPRSASVVALDAAEVLILERSAVLGLLGGSPDMLGAVIGQLTRTVRASSERLLREELEQRAQRAEAEAERLRALAEMVAGVAHEVNTPLGTVNTAASIVQQRLESAPLQELAAHSPGAALAFEDVREALVLIERNVQRAHRLIEQFKKLSVSQIVDTLEELPLLGVVEETVDLYSVSARKAGLQVRLESTVPEGATWTGYRGMLSQVIINLLTNAERYAYPAGTGGRVDIAVATAADAAGEELFELTVRDYGRGIPADTLPRIFDPFFTTGRMQGGTGLGLSIVHNLVTEALGGTIEARSEPGVGTELRIRLPHEVPA